MKSKINKADSQCHPHKIHNLPLKPFTAIKVKPKHSVFYLLQCLKYEPGSLTRARVRRIPAFLSVVLTTFFILLYPSRFVNHFFMNIKIRKCCSRTVTFFSPKLCKRPADNRFPQRPSRSPAPDVSYCSLKLAHSVCPTAIAPSPVIAIRSALH